MTQVALEETNDLRRKSQSPMKTLGIDLSASPERTAIATIEWGGGAARVAPPLLGLDDAALADRLAAADWAGIDAPFGWPEAMVLAIYEYATSGRWSPVDKAAFRYRRTDRFVREHVEQETGKKLWPLSPSSDRIALAAWRLAQLREHYFDRTGIRFDRAGADRIVEVYPAAALLLWGLDRRGYKTGPRLDRRAPAEAAREALLASIEAQAPWLVWEPGAREACIQSDDALDAVLAALIARAAALGLTEPPPPDDLELARGEGWLHLPRKGSLSALSHRSNAESPNQPSRAATR